MIPSNITRAHCIRAAMVIGAETVPSQHRSTKFDVVINDKRYPPKWIIHIANEFANKERRPTGRFHGGIEANGFLSERRFSIRQKVAEEARDLLFRWLPQSVAVDKPLDWMTSSRTFPLRLS